MYSVCSITDIWDICHSSNQHKYKVKITFFNKVSGPMDAHTSKSTFCTLLTVWFYNCVCHILFSFFLLLSPVYVNCSASFRCGLSCFLLLMKRSQHSGRGSGSQVRDLIAGLCSLHVKKHWPPIALGGCSIGVRLEKLCIIAVHLAFHTQLGCIHNLHTVGMLIFVLTAVQTSRRVLYLHVWHL